MSKDTKGITEKKENNPAAWYTEIVLKADVADFAPIQGCMVIRPRGYAIWEAIQDYFNKVIEKNGVRNAYFPMFIPEEFFKREAKHAEGFNPEVAWIERKTENDTRYAIRPTSETIIYDSYSKWIRSYRDLPLKINQWANIVRWETKDCKLFFRSREFLWQEGHCVYRTEEECHKETLFYLKKYQELARDLLALPSIAGQKTEKEKFAGALRTYSFEGFTVEGKALQMGTTHDLGQGFAKVFDVKYQDEDGEIKHPWQNSWGISTRLIGATIMTHSDNKGLILPPKVVKEKVVIIPIYFKNSDRENVLSQCRKTALELSELNAFVDDREGYTPGYKFNEHELKGVPIRIEIGPKDIETDSVVMVARDNGEKRNIKIGELKKAVNHELKEMHSRLYKKAESFLKSRIDRSEEWDDFVKKVKEGKMVLVPFCGSEECEDTIKEKTKGITSRCIPFEQPKDTVKKSCIHCKDKAKYYTYFARAY